MTCPYCGFTTPYWAVSCTCPQCQAHIDCDDVPEDA